MGRSLAVCTFSALAAIAVPHCAVALPACQEAPAAPGAVTDVSSSGTRFTAIGEATIMSETVEGLALAEDAARLDAKAALNADRRISKTANDQLQGVRDLWACRTYDKVFVTEMWDFETAKQAADLSAAMSRDPATSVGTQGVRKPSRDRSVFDRLMR